MEARVTLTTAPATGVSVHLASQAETARKVNETFYASFIWIVFKLDENGNGLE